MTSALLLALPACVALAVAPTGPAAGLPAPLDRVVAFQARDISLRDALDRLAAAARIRFSYSGESLPLDRPVCVSFDSVAVGVALALLLEGTAVEPVVAGADYVVLAPLPTVPSGVTRVVVLDRIVVTGSVGGAPQRPLPIALDVLDGRILAQQAAGTLSQVLNGAVPGLWLWDQSPSSLLAQYGSIRGSSSFGLSYPKVFIDGIEVANPLLITRIIPDVVERIEVIRGPQGAALYGADAISGVTNIVTRQETAEEGAPRARLQSGVGLSASDYSARATFGQTQLLTVRGGTNTRSAGLTLEGGTDGAFVPGAFARRLTAVGSARNVAARSILTGTLRLFAERAGSPLSPILTDSLAVTRPPAVADQSVVEYTVGATYRIMPNDHWTHSLVAGVDGYSLSGVPDDRTPIPSAADSALRAARGGAARGTIRLSSVARVGIGARASMDVTLAAEQSVLWQRTTTGQPGAPELSQWRSASGMSALVSATLFDRLFLTSALRLERATGAGGVALPMLGAAWATERGPGTLKLRGVYGRGIRWPQTTPRETLWEGMRPEAADRSLEPEEQSGVEGGLDLIVGGTATLQVTRFDQTATGLIQRVGMPDTTSSRGPGPQRIAYQLQNVGEITNRGWELQGLLVRGAFSLAGAVSLVDSRVRRLANGYTGDLQPGDRMLGVPSRAVSVTASWSGARWGVSISAYRAEDWTNYDRLGLAQAVIVDSQPPQQLTGPALRAYWRTYPGVTHLRAAASGALRRGLALTLSGDNLLDRQRGEPDNITVLPGRTVSLGVRAEF